MAWIPFNKKSEAFLDKFTEKNKFKFVLYNFNIYIYLRV